MRKEFQLANNDILGNGSFGEDNPGIDINQLDIFRDKPFWIWDQKEHDIKFRETNGKCCHVDILGRPQKDGKDYPLFDFQQQIFEALENNQSIWILKSRGIGLSTCMLYWITWKILSGSELSDESVFIISGTREEHANYLKEKMAKLFERNFPSINLYTKYTEMILKSTWIKVFPSTVNSIKDIRGYFSTKIIWVDESDYIPENVIDELVAAITPYQTKSNAKIILSSTPFKPLGLMQKIELDPDSKYFKLKLPYQLGVGKIYNTKEIESKKNGVEWKREMELQYLGKIGNLLTSQQVDHCVKLGEKYSIDKVPMSLYSAKSAGVDFGFSSSATSIVVLEHMGIQLKEGVIQENIIRVIDCYLIEKGTPEQILDICWSLWAKYGYMNLWFFCDASNAGMINMLKHRWGESLNWIKTGKVSTHSNTIIPVSFNTEHKEMLSRLHLLASGGYLAIDSKYDKLITSLRTAYANELSLDKERTTWDDLLDGLRLGLKPYDPT